MNKKGFGELLGVFLIATVIFIGVWFLWAFSIVEYNEYAYENEFGKLSNDLKTQGFNYVGFGTLIRINNQVRAYNIHVDAATKDMQEVKFDVNINAKLKKEESYNLLKDYKDENTFFTYVNNKIQEKAKTVIYKYDAKEMLDRRLEIGNDIKTEVSKMPELKYFELDDVALANIQYSEEYNKVIEAKAKIDIERDIILKQKENLELQKKNIESIDVDTYFKYQLIEKWDGKTPLIISDSLLSTSMVK